MIGFAQRAGANFDSWRGRTAAGICGGSDGPPRALRTGNRRELRGG